MVDAHVALIIVLRVSLFNGAHKKAKETKHLSNGIKTLHGQSQIFLLKCLGCFMASIEPFREEKSQGGTKYLRAKWSSLFGGKKLTKCKKTYSPNFTLNFALISLKKICFHLLH